MSRRLSSHGTDPLVGDVRGPTCNHNYSPFLTLASSRITMEITTERFSEVVYYDCQFCSLYGCQSVNEIVRNRISSRDAFMGLVNIAHCLPTKTCELRLEADLRREEAECMLSGGLRYELTSPN